MCCLPSKMRKLVFGGQVVTHSLLAEQDQVFMCAKPKTLIKLAEHITCVLWNLSQNSNPLIRACICFEFKKWGKCSWGCIRSTWEQRRCPVRERRSLGGSRDRLRRRSWAGCRWRPQLWYGRRASTAGGRSHSPYQAHRETSPPVQLEKRNQK